MRLSVSKKIFLAFLLLTTLTSALALSVAVGFESIIEDDFRIHTVQNFKLHLSRTQVLLQTVSYGTPSDQGVSFDDSIKELYDISRSLRGFGGDYGDDLQQDLDNLPEHIENYQRSFEEYLYRLKNDRAFHGERQAIASALVDAGEGLPPEDRSRFSHLLNYFLVTQDRIYYQRDAKGIPSLKTTLDGMSGLALDGDAVKGLEKLFHLSENNYLNYLASENRSAYLLESSRVFLGLAEDTISSIVAEIGKKRRRYEIIVLSIFSLVILSVLSLWSSFSRYVRRFLKALNHAFRSIKKGDFDYATDVPSDDELGDLVLFVKDMSLTIKEGLEKEKDSRLFLQNIIDAVADPIMLIGLDHTVRLMNRAASSTASLPPETEGRMLCHLLSHHSEEPCSGEGHPCPLSMVSSSMDVVTVVHQHRLPDGSVRHIEIVASPLLSEDGSLEGIIEASRDITDRVKAEEALTRAKDDLERQYLELQKMDKIKEGLIRDVSHELKTPVAKQAMQLEILKPIVSKHRLTDEEKRALTVMEENIARQESVITNLLDLSRLEKGERKYRQEPVRIDELIEKVVRDYQHAFDRYGGAISSSVPPLTIVGDGEMLWHLFSNVVHNSIKYRKSGLPANIDFSFEKNEESFSLVVTDDGQGMTSKEVEKAFDRFYQSSASQEGSGVGLTICRMIAEGLGGRIDIGSEGPGRGTVVTVTLPLKGTEKA